MFICPAVTSFSLGVFLAVMECYFILVLFGLI